ncbi:MAG: hypothetical protein LBC59_01470 [Chitinispirillales bacterium]|jgi:hypothetical protein|nr:hypothetical protein [Chitinispirillales bacterium]
MKPLNVIKAIKISTLILLSLILLSPAQMFARPVVGSGSFTQFGKPTKEMLSKARAVAAAEFRTALHVWLKENMRIDVDTMNTIKHFAFGKFADRCLESAEETSVGRGRVWTVSLTVSDSDVREAFDSHNEYFDGLAASRFQEARGNDLNEALPGAIGALCAAMAKIEGASGGDGVNVNDIRANVQILFDKMEVKSATTVVDGRQGSFPNRSPDAVFTIDGAPLTGFHLTATVQGGRVLARFVTDEHGGVPLRSYKVPFVHNGSMLNVTPDARGYIKADGFIRYKDLGVRFNKGQDLSYIYKVPALTYTLEYKASSLSKSIVIPPDFLADAHVRKYLKEYCGLVPASSRGSADMNVKVAVEFSQNTHNDTEEDGYAMRAVAEFRGAGVERVGKTVFEKRLNFGLTLQSGEYFWEASGALRKLIGDALSQDN